jgi:hypothetical protein
VHATRGEQATEGELHRRPNPYSIRFSVGDLAGESAATGHIDDGLYDGRRR